MWGLSKPMVMFLAVALPLACGGCLIPSYKQPAGFSSSYFRHLHNFSPPPHVQAGLPLPLPGLPAAEAGGILPMDH